MSGPQRTLNPKSGAVVHKLKLELILTSPLERYTRLCAVVFRRVRDSLQYLYLAKFDT